MKYCLLTAAAVLVAISTASAGGPDNTPNWGTDILHYTLQDRFTNGSVEADASAVVQLQFKSQGNSELQKFDFSAKRLTPNTTYWLSSLNKGETNYNPAAEFTTDAKGNARVRYQGNQAPNQGKGHGNGNQPFPDALEPVIDIQSLALVNVNTQTVLHADLGTPDRLQLLVKRKLEGDTAAGLLRIEGTLKKIHFDLQVVRLAPTNDYWLAINGVVVRTTRSDDKGRLRINATTTPVNSPLDIYQVQLLDTSTNTVLATELP